MSIYGGKEMAASFRTVRKNTIQTAEEIPENQYSFRATPETRTVAETLAHIAIAPGWQHHIHSNRVDDLMKVNFMEMLEKFTAEEKKPRSKAEIVAFLKVEGDKFASFLESLSDSFLAERVAMPPGDDVESKTRFEMLLGPKEHEMHHRAQLMTMQRMIGMVPHLTRRMNERMAQMQPQMQQPTR
jgi:uncharacterized damage-inducible protein DinB